MKKISLKNLNIQEVEQLSREQLKDVLGGSWGGETGTGTGTTNWWEPETGTSGGDQCYCDRGEASFYLPNPTGKPCSFLCG